MTRRKTLEQQQSAGTSRAPERDGLRGWIEPDHCVADRRACGHCDAGPGCLVFPGRASARRTRSTAGSETVAAAAVYVGSQSCAQCHAAEAKAWQASQHAVAMQHATERTVLGDFNDATYSFQGVTVEVLPARRQVLHPHGRSGRPARGLRGQVHVRRCAAAAVPGRVARRAPAGRRGRPGMRGRANRVASAGSASIPTRRSTTRTNSTGRVGRRTGTSCAPTATRPSVRKGYDAASDAFKTTYAEISVGCEACHGPGSAHIEWAKAQGQRTRARA